MICVLQLISTKMAFSCQKAKIICYSVECYIYPIKFAKNVKMLKKSMLQYAAVLDLPYAINGLHTNPVYYNLNCILQRVRKLLKPTKEWGPRKEEHREEYLKSLEYSNCQQNGYMLAMTEENNMVKRNIENMPEEKTLLA